MPRYLPARADMWLNLLKAAEGWMTREELAHTIGKSELTPYDVLLLRLMEESGLIQRRRRHEKKRSQPPYEYKSK